MSTSDSPPVAPLLFTAFSICLHLVFLPVVVAVSYRFATEWKKGQKLLLSLVIGFNVITLLSVAGLLFLAIFQFLSLLNLTDLERDAVYNGYHSIFVLFYGKQNCLMLLVLYLRLKSIFRGTSMALSQCTNTLFMAGFAFALTLFVSLPILHAVFPDISIWTWCSSTFCFYNLMFMLSLTSLFLYKLVNTYKLGDSVNRDQTMQQKMLFMITKTSMLAISSIACTMVSCIFLIIRFTFHSSNAFVIGFSNLMIVVDVYTNWIFITLCFKYYAAYYKKMCGVLHPFCAQWWKPLLVASPDGKEAGKQIDNHAETQRADHSESPARDDDLAPHSLERIQSHSTASVELESVTTH